MPPRRRGGAAEASRRCSGDRAEISADPSSRGVPSLPVRCRRSAIFASEMRSFACRPRQIEGRSGGSGRGALHRVRLGGGGGRWC